MKKLYQNLALFLLPFLLVLILVPVNKRLRYEGLRNDCFNHGIWIHDRIFTNKKNIDIAILGSSQSLNAVEDAFLEESFGKYTVANLAYCRLGRNLSYVFLKELIQEKKPQTLILEIRPEENNFTHPIFPYVAESKDVLLTNPVFYKGQFEDIYENLLYKISLLQKMSLGSNEKESIRIEDFGHSNSPDTANFAYLEDRKKKFLSQISEHKWPDTFGAYFPKSYVEKMMALCEEHNIQVYFLYLAPYGLGDQIPLEKDFYEAHGEILYPPLLIVENPEYWHDDKHLNTAGAHEFSKWLAGVLQEKVE